MAKLCIHNDLIMVASGKQIAVCDRTKQDQIYSLEVSLRNDAAEKEQQKAKGELEILNLFDKSINPRHLTDENVMALPCRWPVSDRSGLEALLEKELDLSEPSSSAAVQWHVDQLPLTSKSAPRTQKSKFLSAVRQLVEKDGCWTDELERGVPKRWERHGDMILLPADSFLAGPWATLNGPQLWITVANALDAKHVARRSTVIDNGFRSPQVALLLGEDGWVTHIDNGIRYCFDVTKSMFSAGNISEKLRIAKMDCRGLIVVDLFAGIGYFTLPFLVHSGAKLVHACEWNPDSLLALEKSLQANGVRNKCVIHAGDNRKVAPVGVAQHVNLGLIPSSRCSWEVACRALNPVTGGMLHVHGNVTSRGPRVKQSETSTQPQPIATKRTEWSEWAQEVTSDISDILRNLNTGSQWLVRVEHVEHVKSYAPHVDHLVVDLRCEPMTSVEQKLVT